MEKNRATPTQHLMKWKILSSTFHAFLTFPTHIVPSMVLWQKKNRKGY